MWINTFRSRRFVSFFCQGSVSDGKQVTKEKMVLSHFLFPYSSSSPQRRRRFANWHP